MPPATINNKRINELFVAVEVLQRESVERNKQTGELVDKMDKTIEKFQDLSIKITEMLTRHDASIGSLNAETNKQASENTKNFDDLKKDQGDLRDRVTKLEQWKWMIMGGSMTVAALFSQIDKLIGLFR